MERVLTPYSVDNNTFGLEHFHIQKSTHKPKSRPNYYSYVNGVLTITTDQSDPRSSVSGFDYNEEKGAEYPVTKSIDELSEEQAQNLLLFEDKGFYYVAGRQSKVINAKNSSSQNDLSDNPSRFMHGSICLERVIVDQEKAMVYYEIIVPKFSAHLLCRIAICGVRPDLHPTII